MGQHGAADHARHHGFFSWADPMRENVRTSGRIVALKISRKAGYNKATLHSQNRSK
jgi:hypothetical protein